MTELLYATEQEIAAAVLGRGHFPEWKALAVVLERDGLPKVDPIAQHRYFPAVKQFLDRRHGVIDRGPPPAEFSWTPRRPVDNRPSPAAPLSKKKSSKAD